MLEVGDFGRYACQGATIRSAWKMMAEGGPPACRLFIDGDLGDGLSLAPSNQQSHYLRHVLRLPDGAPIGVFNGRDGEWLACLKHHGKRSAALDLIRLIKAQPPVGDLHLLFAPLKHARLDYMVQKAVEMGASCLVPVITRHTQVGRVNLGRMRANAIEAAEQCNILALPEIRSLTPLDEVLRALEPERLLIFCDEAAQGGDPLAALRAAQRGPLAVLIGPEGGFAEEERARLLIQPSVVRLSLGPRIVRADTAAVAALALVQACLGDWSKSLA
jgi:16S rRNA (uracil1498-N3)-methyltransferase